MTKGKRRRNENRDQHSRVAAPWAQPAKKEVDTPERQPKPSRRDAGEGKSSKPSQKITARVRAPALFILGTLFGLYVVRWFVGFLPGPSVLRASPRRPRAKWKSSGVHFLPAQSRSERPRRSICTPKSNSQQRSTTLKLGFQWKRKLQTRGEHRCRSSRRVEIRKVNAPRLELPSTTIQTFNPPCIRKYSRVPCLEVPAHRIR